MTMGPWWCSRESKGQRLPSWLRFVLPLSAAHRRGGHIPRGYAQAAPDGRRRLRCLRRPRSAKTDSCPRVLPCSAAASAIGDSRCEPPDCPPPRGPTWAGSFPNSSARACLISSFLPHTWWILSRLDGSHSVEALSWRDLAGEIRLRRTGSRAPICTEIPVQRWAEKITRT
jgi:hypothetical protein